MGLGLRLKRNLVWVKSGAALLSLRERPELTVTLGAELGRSEFIHWYHSDMREPGEAT